MATRPISLTLVNADARLGAVTDRHSFTVVDLHLLLFAGNFTVTASIRSVTDSIWRVEPSRIGLKYQTLNSYPLGAEAGS